MPYISNSTAQSLSALVRGVLNEQNTQLNNARSLMRLAKLMEGISGEKMPKEMKDAAWASIHKGNVKLKRNAELQVQLKKHLSKAQD